jgi:hypothetical protein
LFLVRGNRAIRGARRMGTIGPAREAQPVIERAIKRDGTIVP